MSADPKPIGSPFQAPRDCILFGWTLEEKESIARAQKTRRHCWHCGRWFLPRYVSGQPLSDCCSLECLELRELCWKMEREEQIGLWPNRPDPMVTETAWLAPFVPDEHTAAASVAKHDVWAFCPLCKEWLGPWKRKADGTRELRRHLKNEYGQRRLFG